MDGKGRPTATASEAGYQFKFFPSPLSDNHRAEIEISLKQAIDHHKKSKINTWILVTPDDLTETGRRKSGGDASWFSTLASKYNPPFEICHIGHTKIIYLFLKFEILSLYYYPEIVFNGANRKINIQKTREKYDRNIVESHGRIELVGMSVYKEEAARGVPLEDIYIPLSVVSEGATNVIDATPRLNPLQFLEPGSKTVILGDPGSGKSTLISCLALVGTSIRLQKRTGGHNDDRLSIFVTLRRYADELKTRKNLSISEYIVENCRADYNIPEIDWEFFEFYLKSGKAKLFFDGLDELPNPQYKKIVRDRIQSFTISNPENAIIITSRIVGYEGPIRFRGEQFKHFKVAQLRVNEIEIFINDWYKIRVENEADRKANAKDLLRIIRHPENSPIRELARNPLLLTIVALVHRIDAVLPDQRVILYKKCTETLLDTWYKWKYRADEEINKARIERRNRQRIEAIAHWMQRRASGDKGRAVVSFTELQKFLSNHIAKFEPGTISDTPPDDAADEFLKFVKERTGLLIEVGDEQYSFVHLTFQEYLTATFLATDGETDGVASIWAKLQDCAFDPRWQEVIRLLVASFRSDLSQKYFVNKLMEFSKKEESILSILTPASLLLDGIEAAEARRDEILTTLFSRAISTDSEDTLQSIGRISKLWLSKDPQNEDKFSSVINKFSPENSTSIIKNLTSISVGISPKFLHEENKEEFRSIYGSLFLGIPLNPSESEYWKNEIEISNNTYDHMATISSDLNVIAASAQGFSLIVNGDRGYIDLFRRQLYAGARQSFGPFHDLTLNTLIIALESDPRTIGIRDNQIETALSGRPRRFESTVSRIARSISRHNPNYVSHIRKHRSVFDVNNINKNTSHGALSEKKSAIVSLKNIEESGFWLTVQAYEETTEILTRPLTSAFKFKPQAQWKNAVRTNVISRIPAIISNAMSAQNLEKNIDILAICPNDTNAAHFGAWWIMIEVWLLQKCQSAYSPSPATLKLIEIARKSQNAALRIAAHIYQAILTPSKIKLLETDLLSRNSEEIWAELSRCNWTSRDLEDLDESELRRTRPRAAIPRPLR